MSCANQDALQPTGRHRKDLPLVALVVVLAGLGALIPRQAGLASHVRLPAEAGSVEDSVVGQLQASASAFLWEEVEETIHAGVAMRPLRLPHPPDHPDHRGHAAGPSPGAEEEHHSGLTTAIPSARRDFRGLLGELDRQVHPYFEPEAHRHESPEKTIPLFRLMTWANPRFVQGYTVGATILCDAGKNVGEAVAFLREGERHNPHSIEIQTELGRYSLYYLKDCAAAERHLRRALELARQRDLLTEAEQEARHEAYRWLALTYRTWGKAEQAVAVAEEGRRVVGPDVVLDNVIAQRGKA